MQKLKKAATDIFWAFTVLLAGTFCAIALGVLCGMVAFLFNLGWEVVR